MSQTEEGGDLQGQWHPDPSGRFQFRFWDGTRWTEHVSTDGVVSADPLPPAPHSSVVPAAIAPAEGPAPSAPAPSVPTFSESQQPGLQEAARSDRGIFDRVKRGKAAFDAARLTGSIDELRAEYEQLAALLVETRDAVLLQEAGLYEFRHPLDDSDAYKRALEVTRSRLQEMVRGGCAVIGPKDWTVNGSAAQGRKMVNDLGKLVLRAYNAEADSIVRSMRPYGLESAVTRLSKARVAVCRLVSTVKLSIDDGYHALRVHELELTADFLAKRETEREAARAERERLKEEEVARREYEARQSELRRELDKRVGALQRLIAGGVSSPGAVAEMEAGIAEVQAALSGVEARMANLRAGHLYVISNFGSFGERVVKIGMTRRLDPLDRVRELGDASVPFRFDVHALVFAEDAVGLETKLHQRFAARRVNLVNHRREFFYVTPAEVRAALEEYVGHVVVEFSELAEALEWRQSTNTRSVENAIGPDNSQT